MVIETECAHCARPMRIEIDSQLKVRPEDGCKPIIFVPDIDIINIKDAGITDAF